MGIFKALINVVALIEAVMNVGVKLIVMGALMIPIASAGYLIYIIIWNL